MPCQQRLKFYEFTCSYQKIYPSGALVHGVPLTRCWSPMNPSDRVRRWCARRRKRPWRPSRRRQSRPGFPKPKVLTFMFFFLRKKKASRTWVDEDFCLLKKFSENHSATVWCLIFSGCPSWRGFGCLGLQKSGFCKIWMCNSELGATNSMDTSVSSWLQLMNVAT